MSIDLATGVNLRILEALGIVLALIVLDFLVGLLKGISTTGFSFQKFPNQLASFVLPYFVPLLALALWVILAPALNLAGVVGGSAAAFFTAAAAVALKAIADIGQKLGVNFAPALAPPAQAKPPGTVA